MQGKLWGVRGGKGEQMVGIHQWGEGVTKIRANERALLEIDKMVCPPPSPLLYSEHRAKFGKVKRQRSSFESRTWKTLAPCQLRVIEEIPAYVRLNL